MWIKRIIFICLILAIAGVASWQVFSEEPSKNKLNNARLQYMQGNFAQSASLFQEHIQKIAAQPNKETEMEEAKLGLIASQLLAKMPEWKQNLKSWKTGIRGYWQNKAFLISEDLPVEEKSHFNQFFEKPDFPYAGFILLRFLISQNHYQVIPAVIAETEYKSVAWHLCCVMAWLKLRDNQYATSAEFFSLLCENSPEIKENSAYGLLLAKILANTNEFPDMSPISSQWHYRMDMDTVELFRNSSPLKNQEAIIKAEPLSEIQPIVASDLLFVLGRKSKNRADIWQKGLQFLNMAKKRSESSKLNAAYLYMETRFDLAIAWNNYLQGNIKMAESTFTKYLNEKAKPECQAESKLGLALIAFKEEESLKDLVSQLSPWKEGFEYWLGGRQFSFYRIKSREKNKKEIEELCKQEEHRIYLTVLDAFSLLGDGRAAQTVLRKVVAEYPEEIHKIYLEEEPNIPRDAYAENQIWEKLE